MKKIISVLLTLALVFAMGALTVFAETRTTITNPATISIAAGAVVTVNDTDFIVNSAAPLFNLTGDNARLVLNNCTVTYTVGGTDDSGAEAASVIKVGVGLTGIAVELNDTTITMQGNYSRGITFLGAASGSVTLNDSKILFPTAPNANSSYSRGISTYQNTATSAITINLFNSEISGCYYPINLAGQNAATPGVVTVFVDHTKLEGYGALNIWTPGNTITVTNGSQLIGRNYYNGDDEGFAVINLYPGATNNTITITGSIVSAVATGTCVQSIIADWTNGTTNSITFGTGTSVFYPSSTIHPYYFITEWNDTDGDGVLTETAHTEYDKGGVTNYNDSAATFTTGAASEVTANADVTYTVIIPASVNFGTINKSMPEQSRVFNVSVEGAFVKENSIITVTNTTTPLEMKDNNGAGSKILAFTLARENGIFSFAAADLTDGTQTIASTVSCDPINLPSPGNYKGFMTFAVSYVEN